MMNQVQQILEKIELMLLEMGFEEIVVENEYRNEKNYAYGNLYCIPQYVDALGFLVEYADSYEEAKKHGHEDGDSFPMELGEAPILEGIKQEVKKILGR